jgi:hypothetical protein
MRKRVGLMAGVALSLALGSPVLAGQPANQACLGETVSAAAQQGIDYGQFVASTAQGNQGVGATVQVLLAGNVPDQVFPNTCND